MREVEIPGITEGLPELEPTVIIVIFIIILIWAILWFFVPFWVFGMWRRMKNIEGLIRQQVEGSKQEIDEETKKILDEMGYQKGVHRDRDD
jgi:uncharacterized ion transporter superfamily protein YfcC